LQVIDISNPANPQQVGGWSSNARGVAVSGNYAYVADDAAGLQVIDVSNPANPRRVGGNGLFTAFDAVVAGNKVFVADLADGLIIFDLFRPSPPSLTIRRTGSNTVTVSWPSTATGFVLQQNTTASLQSTGATSRRAFKTTAPRSRWSSIRLRAPGFIDW
jgi:hypothetical protein